MTDFKVLLRELIFGVDYGKCEIAYDLYINQLGLQLTQIRPLLDKQNLSQTQVIEMFAEYNILGVLPFIHFSSLYIRGIISKRELVAILYHMCEVSGQPSSLVYQIFNFMDSTITAETVSEARELEFDEYKHFVEDNGIIPLLIHIYHQVTTEGGNIYASVIDLIVAIKELDVEPINE